MKKKKTNELNFESKEIKKNRQVNDDYKMVIGFVVMLVIIAFITILLYFFNGKYVTKDLINEKPTTTQATYDDTKITVADIFKIKKDNYYVLLYNTEDDISFLYSNLSASYTNKKVPLYTIDMANALNKKYYNIDGKENKNVTKYEDLVITKPTLIEIKNKKIVSYKSNKDDIVNILSKN